MAIEPIRIHLPFDVDGGGVPMSFVLEEYLTGVTALHEPSLLFWNTSAEDVDLQVEFLLSWGASGNPFEAGNYRFDVVASATITAGSQLAIDLKPNVEVLLATSAAMPITHNITLTNSSGSDAMVRFILSGYWDQIGVTAVNAYVRRQGLS